MSEPNDILFRITIARISSCNCGTKTPELKYHQPNCTYRVLMDAGDEIYELRTAIEAMRVAGGSAEFQAAFDRAKELIK